MAQVCGGTSFDYQWERVHEVALGVLKKAADSWASDGTDAVSVDAVIAVLLRVYLSEWPMYGGIRREARDLQSWLDLVGTANEEIVNLGKKASSEIRARVLRVLAVVLSSAVRQWSLGNPESPSTARALNVIEHVLFTHKLTRRPPRSKLPPGLLPAFR